MFDFSIMADVTDITGETRSSETRVSAGYVALSMALDLPREIELDSLRSISLNTTNFAGQPQTATGTIEITRLVAPMQQFVTRYWENPDVLTLAEADFRRDFPNYAWNGEDNPEKWGRQDFTRPVNFNTGAATKVDLHGGSMSTGYYEVLLKTKRRLRRIHRNQAHRARVWDAKNRATQFRCAGWISGKKTPRTRRDRPPLARRRRKNALPLPAGPRRQSPDTPLDRRIGRATGGNACAGK
ncbi:MAG: hypothetical protein IPM98_11545 [Lewinellaceae bacterium]|nr:hypothetical protein [Lewinellaceae bacterium]